MSFPRGTVSYPGSSGEAQQIASRGGRILSTIISGEIRRQPGLPERRRRAFCGPRGDRGRLCLPSRQIRCSAA